MRAGWRAIPIGVLYDFPQHDGGAGFEEAVRVGLGPAAEDVELHPVEAIGLPSGTEMQLVAGFRELADAGVVAVIGPSISDNGVVIRDHADVTGLACINYTGGAITRSAWMFHYQVGSLEEEPIVITEHLERTGRRSAAVLYDASIVGEQYLAALLPAAADRGIKIVAHASVAATAEDLSAPIAQMRDAGPEALCYLGLGVAARAVALAVKDAGWSIPVVCNSALMFGYMRRDWREDWDGWVYVDTVADDNPQRVALKEISPKSAAGPVGIAAYDIGRMLAVAINRADAPTRAGIRSGLERVKRLPATTGYAGTTMGFGVWDHAALKGGYLVLREWRDGRSVQLPL